MVNTLYGNVAGLRLMGAAAVELCYIAAGRFEARIEAFIGPWDIAAGTIILQNAGGMITDFKEEILIPLVHRFWLQTEESIEIC